MALVAAGVAPAALAATASAAPTHHAPAHHHVSHIGRHAHGVHAAASSDALTALDHRYLKLYNEVVKKLGTRAPGRNIVRDGLTSTKPASNADITKSIGTLTGMVAATQTVIPGSADAVTAASTTTSSTTTTTTTPTAESSAPASGLTQCIIQRESGGDPTVVNSSGHMGEGQWDESTWLADGGGKYGATPLDASGAEQQQVIESQVAAGNTGQWTEYDGC
jgi:hypothetical protein